MSHYKPYLAYKDSGVKWLGTVPAHWNVTRLKYNLRHISEKTDRRERTVALENIESWTGKLIETDTEFEGDGVAFKVGDILFGKLRPYLAKAYLATTPGEAVGDVFVVRPSIKISPQFSHYQVLSREFIDTVDGSTCGAKMPRVNWDFFGDMLLTVPLIEEQCIIVDHLNHETARIDNLIYKKTYFIYLLREKRQALITHAVTKGLDLQAKMMDSGVDWLGEVPAHWNVLSFQRCVSVAKGQVDPEISPFREMILLAPNHIESGTGRILYTETANDQHAESGKYICEKGDIVYSKIRPALRKVCIATLKCLCSADMYPLRAHSGMTNAFLFWFLLSEPFSAFSVLEANRVAMPKINRESLNNLFLPMPSIKDQFSIANYLSLETERIDTLIIKTERSIELIKERRSALITAAVTGQIDLREAA